MNTILRKKIFLTIFLMILLLILSGTTLFIFKQDNTLTPNSIPSPKNQVGATLPPLFQYGEIINSCGPYFDGVCVNLRSGPGKEYPVITKLRNNIILKVSERVEANGEGWYKIIFDEWLRYPERVTSDMYVSAGFVETFLDEGSIELAEGLTASSTKYIIIDRSNQKLSAYDGDKLFLEESISTGIELTPTPRGIFTIYKKTPTRYMQGPLPNISEKEYDLPGVPWNLYFTAEGAVIHGAYWHDKFGQPWSNGCVNLPPKKAKELYDWAGLGTKVIVQD